MTTEECKNTPMNIIIVDHGHVKPISRKPRFGQFVPAPRPKND